MFEKRPNIILITVDSLRVDRLGCYGYNKPTSPNLDEFAKQSDLFTHAFSSGPNTPHAFPGIMAARSSLMSKRLGLFDTPVTLAEVLQNAGYTTVGINAANPYCSSYFKYNRGFEEFHDYLDLTLDNQFPNSRNGGNNAITVPEFDLEHFVVSEKNIHRKACLENEFNHQILNVLEQISKERFFLWVHYMDCHYPFLPQMETQAALGIDPISKEENFKLNTYVRENLALSATMLNKLIDLYDAAIKQLDSKIGELFAFLKRASLFDSSLIIVTADHGEEFLDHGDLQHKSKLFDELIHVPLLMKSPEQEVGFERKQLVSLIQLAPTIVSVIGQENPFEIQPFSNDFENSTDRKNTPVFSEASYGKNGGTPTDQNMFNIDRHPKRYCYRDRQWKLTHDTGEKKNYLFDLLRDPGETENVYRKKFELAALLRNELNQHIMDLERESLRPGISRLRKKLLLHGQKSY